MSGRFRNCNRAYQTDHPGSDHSVRADRDLPSYQGRVLRFGPLPRQRLSTLVPQILFRQVRWLDPYDGTDRVMDLGWDTERAERTVSSAPDRIIEGHGRLVVGPGLTDLYARSGEPGYEERETLDSLAAAARAGGYSRVTLLPSTTPPVDDPAQVDFLRKHFPAMGVEPIVLGAISHGLAGEQLAEVGYLAEAGVAGFTDDRPIQNWMLLRRFLDYVRVLNKPVLLWPCLSALAGGIALEGQWSIRLGLSGMPVQAQTTALAMMLELVVLSGTPVHFMRLSTARSVDLLRQAKASGLPVSGSVTIHHLIHGSPELESYDPCLRFDPPLGNPEDQLALIEGVADGTIDAVASDHTPWTYEEKHLPFAQAPAGSIALELVLPLIWRLVAEGRLSALRAWEVLSTGPEQVLRLEAQQRTTLVMFDPNRRWEVNQQSLHSRSLATAWLGKTVQGKVLETFV